MTNINRVTYPWLKGPVTGVFRVVPKKKVLVVVSH